MRRTLLLLSVLVALFASAPAIAEACISQSKAVIVELSTSKYPGTTSHIRDAIAAGHPALLNIDRVNADRRRRESLEGIPTKPGYDRDEYPPAATRQGGKGASVRYVLAADNRGAGSVMGNALRNYCEGQLWRFKLVA